MRNAIKRMIMIAMFAISMIFVGNCSLLEEVVAQVSGGTSCGDGSCNGNETQSTCVLDCGMAPSCGDHFCASTESNANCAIDCPAVGAVCGDTYCNGTETTGSCPNDCGHVCGDYVCNGGETSVSCFSDCGSMCGDGICNGTENSAYCPGDCSVAPMCGDGMCNGTENSSICPNDCPIATYCGNGFCDAGSGETTTNCTLDCGSMCGDGICNGTEDWSNCMDCPNLCGNMTCDYGENNMNCSADCGSTAVDNAPNLTSLSITITSSTTADVSVIADDIDGIGYYELGVYNGTTWNAYISSTGMGTNLTTTSSVPHSVPVGSTAYPYANICDINYNCANYFYDSMTSGTFFTEYSPDTYYMNSATTIPLNSATVASTARLSPNITALSVANVTATTADVTVTADELVDGLGYIEVGLYDGVSFNATASNGWMSGNPVVYTTITTLNVTHSVPAGFTVYPYAYVCDINWYCNEYIYYPGTSGINFSEVSSDNYWVATPSALALTTGVVPGAVTALLTENFESGISMSTITNDATYLWINDSVNNMAGSFNSIKSNIVGLPLTSTCVSMAAPAGSTSMIFDYSLDSETNFDFLTVNVNAITVLQISGLYGWTTSNAYTVAAGDSIQWCYSKDGSYDTVNDSAWIDNITFY